MSMIPALRSTEHRHPDAETCPYCEQPIPNDRAAEIRARFEFKQRQDEIQFEQRVAAARTQLEEASKANLHTLAQQHAAAIAKLEGESVARVSTAVEQAKKATQAETQPQLEALRAAGEAAVAKAQEADKQRLVLEERLATLNTQQDAIVAARTAEARTAFEKSKADEINAIKAARAEDNQKFADQIKKLTEHANGLQQRLEAEEGEAADIKLYDLLRTKFPKDEIRAIKNPNGADIVHEIKHNKQHCGTIIYDSRNRNVWNPKFAGDLRRDLVAGKALHAVLTSCQFPRGNRQICVVDGVIVASIARALVIAEILREEVLRGHSLRASEKNRDRKTAKLYDFIASEGFGNMLDSLEVNDRKLLALDEDEQKAHAKTWKARRLLMTGSQKLHGSIRSEIDRITGAEDTD